MVGLVRARKRVRVRRGVGSQIFDVINHSLLILLGLVTLAPFVYLAFGSITESSYYLSHGVSFLPGHWSLDAYRILIRNGPTGGSMRDVQMPRKCIAGVDQVAVDSYGTSLFKSPRGAPMTPRDLGYLVKAKELGVGENDLTKLKIQEIKLG